MFSSCIKKQDNKRMVQQTMNATRIPLNYATNLKARVQVRKPARGRRVDGGSPEWTTTRGYSRAANQQS